MSLGNVLLRPKKINNASRPRIDELDLATNFLIRLFKGVINDEKAQQIIQGELQAILDQFLSTHTFYIERAKDHLLGWITPFINFFENFINDITDKPPDDAAKALLEKIREILPNLSKTKIEKVTYQLFDIIEEDLGELINNIPDQLLNPILDRLISRLQEDYLNGGSDSDAKNRFLLGKEISSCHKLIIDNLPDVDFSFDRIKSTISELLDKIDLDQIIEKILDIVQSTDDVSTIVLSLLDLVFEQNGNVNNQSREILERIHSLRSSRSPMYSTTRANEEVEETEEPEENTGPENEPEEYLWYASWLLDTSSDWAGWFKHWFVKENVWKKGNKLFLTDFKYKFSTDESFKDVLNARTNYAALRAEFSRNGITLSAADDDITVEIVETNRVWYILDTKRVNEEFTIYNEENRLYVYKGKGIWANNWWQAEPFEDYTFEKINPEKMDKTAYYLTWICDILECTPYITLSFVQRKYASNWFQVAVNLTYGILKLLGPKGANKISKELPFTNAWWKWAVPAVGPIFLSLAEGIYTEEDPGYDILHWLITLFAVDFAEWHLFANWSNMLRDFVLSLLTLVNFHTPAYRSPFSREPGPLNIKKVDGVAMLFVEAGLWILASTLRRRDFGIQVGATYAHAFGWGTLIAFLSALVGTIVAECIAWFEDWPALGWMITKSLTVSTVKSLIYIYMYHDGNTDGGRYNSQGGANFPGYASDPENSPYLLPYPRGRIRRCAQGNQGIWSHTMRTTYSYDFALDRGEDVVASRAGIVHRFHDGDADHSKNDGNFIVIRHDVPHAHDLIADGTQAVTYTRYWHGMHEGVRRAWARKLGIDVAAVTDAMILNQHVDQGELIMLAGDTGISAYNHLHIEVVPQQFDAHGNPILMPDENITIPFVFADVEEDGVPKSLRYYESNNG